MTTTQIDGVSVTTAANVYFDGKCVSHGITFPDTWVTSGAGDKFSVPGNAKFQIRVTEGHAAYHYICHFG